MIDLKKLPGGEAQKLLKEAFVYDPKTGDFKYKFSRGCAKKNNIAGSQRKDGYIAIKIHGFSYYAHRLAWLYITGEWPKPKPFEIDHENQIRNDNRIDNLREVEGRSVQCRNLSLGPRNKSGSLGVNWWEKSQKWRAEITVDTKSVFLGYFETIEEAIQARKQAEEKYSFHKNHGGEKKDLLSKEKQQKGFRWVKQTKKWRAYISINKKEKHLGSFDTKEEAIEARLKAEGDLDTKKP